MNIETFKAGNAEAQKLNAEIQRAHGALEENKRQFDKLCAEYNATYGCNITAENLEAELASVMQTVQAQANAQAQAIAAAKNGIIVDDSANAEAPVAQTAPSPVTGTIPQSQQTVAPVQTAIPQPQTAPSPVQGTIPQPQVAPAPVESVPEAPAPRPMSAASLSSQAFAQSSVAPNLTDPTANAPKTNETAGSIQGTGIPNWGNPGQVVDFSAMLGGKFGG